MPKDESKIRSSEVQAVLKSSPKKTIVWGNIFIIGLLGAFFVSLSTYSVPLQTQLAFRLIYKSDNIKEKDQRLKILITIPFENKLITNKPIRLVYNYSGSVKPMVLIANLDRITKGSDSTIFSASISRKNTTMLENAQHLKMGMIGVVEVTTGHTSLLRLFGSKMTNRL